MSSNIDIFVDAEANEAQFAQEIEALLGIKLELVADSFESYYEFRNDQMALTLGTHGFENDRDLNFEDYRYDISIRALNIADDEKRKRWRDDFAAMVFEKLKNTGKYNLLMVDNLQTKLAEFHPKPRKAQ